jgi:hypothetical protein
MLRAHRVSYEALIGPIPVGLQLDHLCRIRSCVNPDHLEPVSASVNAKRGLTGRHGNHKGGFQKGQKGGPGRPRRPLQVQ